MADVRRPPRPPRRQRAGAGGGDRDRGSDDRGQLFLVAALSIAVLFVGFALLLNTAIFTENLATRNTDPGTDPSISYRVAATDAAYELVIRESANNTNDQSIDVVRDRFSRGVTNWSDTAGLHAARRARVANVSVVSATHGTRFEQTNGSRNFTDKQLSPGWYLGPDWDDGAVRDAHLYVNRDSLPETNVSNIDGLTGGFDSPFEVELKDRNAGDDRHMYVYDEQGNGVDDVTLLFEDENGVVEKCSYQHTGATAHIDLANRSINGTTCDAFDRMDLPDSAVDDKDVKLRFEHGDQATGTYEITIADGADVDGSGDDHVYDNDGTGPGQGSPFVTAVIYDAEIQITYESTDVYYRTTVHVPAPEEVR